jgi:long-chain acyl-CoA synthetase
MMASGKIEETNGEAADPWQLWERVRASHRREVACWCADGSAGWTFARLGEEAERISDWLAREESGDKWNGRVVALGLEQGPDWLAGLLALWRLGAVVLLSGPAGAESTPAMLSALPACGAFGVLRHGPERQLFWERQDHPTVPLPPATSLLKLTSGTSSTPRLLAFSTAALQADLQQILTGMGLEAKDRNFGLLPWSHSYGFSNLVTPLLWAGIPLVTAQDPWPGAIIETLRQSRATVWPTVPALLPGLLQAGFDGTAHLRLVISAGAPLSSTVARQYRQQTKQPVCAFYGSSECGGITFDAEGKAADVEGWVGHPLAHALLDFSAGEDSVVVRGKTLASGHVPLAKEDELSAGYFTLPDILQNVEGGLCLAGRRDDVLNVGGRKVHPQAVETILLRHPGLREVVVFGTPHPGGGDRITALCVPRQAPLPDQDFRLWCETQLPLWQIPRSWQWVDHLPVNERGKLSRTQLRSTWK